MECRTEGSSKQGSVDALGWLAEPRVVAAAGWGGHCGAEQRDRLHEWPSSWPPAHCEATGHCLSEPFHDFGTLVWCQRCVGRIRGHRAVRMLRTSGRMGPGGPPTGTETSTFVLRVRACACVRVRLCLRAGGIVCTRARQARPGRGGRSIRN